MYAELILLGDNGKFILDKFGPTIKYEEIVERAYRIALYSVGKLKYAVLTDLTTYKNEKYMTDYDILPDIIVYGSSIKR